LEVKLNGHYKIALRPDEPPESNPRVKALLRSFDPGAKWTIKVPEDRSMIECREKNAIQSFLEVNLEVEYLTEMVRLATRGEA
jgi:hypothetical protein